MRTAPGVGVSLLELQPLPVSWAQAVHYQAQGCLEPLLMEAWGGNGSSRAVRRFGSWVWGVRGRRAERSRDEGQGGPKLIQEDAWAS